MKRHWTKQEDEVMRNDFPNEYTEVIANRLNRSYSSISNRATTLGLHKSEKFMQMELEKQANRLRITGQKSRFNKDHIPHNKGKEMPEETRKKVSKTWFDKGHEPHNTKFDGYERLTDDGYIEVRIKKGVFRLKHRVIYEQHFGKIPRGMIVVFKDRNTLNFDPKNLEAITRKENMERNTFHRFPPELKSAIKLVKKLKKTINEKQD